jgi:hypothetical protein
MNIYEKVIAVMESIEYLKKDDTVGTGRMQYKAISDEKVKLTLRQAMIKNKLVMHRTKVETEVTSREYEQYDQTKIQYFCEVRSNYRITNAENPEEFIDIQSIGHGVDSQDKSAGKAMTYASKYALLDTFLIPTGDDPDKTHSNDIEQPINNLLTADQLRTLHTLADYKTKEQIKKHYGIKSTKELTKKQANEIIANLMKK